MLEALVWSARRLRGSQRGIEIPTPPIMSHRTEHDRPMGATVFLDTPMDGDSKIECEVAKMIGDVVWAIPEDDAQERVIPLSNVTGVAGDDVEQEIDKIEFSGGRGH